MGAPINVSYRWSANEMLTLNRLHMHYSSQGRKFQRSFRTTGVIFLCMGVLFFCGIGFTPQKLRVFLFGTGFLLASIALLLGVPHLLRKSVLNTYAKKPDKDLLVSYEISAERLSCRSNVASTEMLWRTILKVLRTDQGFLVYVSDIQIHWLPLHGFQNITDVNRFAELAKGIVGEYKDAR